MLIYNGINGASISDRNGAPLLDFNITRLPIYDRKFA